MHTKTWLVIPGTAAAAAGATTREFYCTTRAAAYAVRVGGMVVR